MWRLEIGLAMFWFIPLFLGFVIVGFVSVVVVDIAQQRRHDAFPAKGFRVDGSRQ